MSARPLPVAALAVLLCLEPELHAAAPATPWEWQQEEVARFAAGLRQVQLEGWGRLNAKVYGIARQLVDHSGMVFPIVPAQTFTIGQAHAGGWILLDLSTATRPKDELAFWLAHEWGHEALGHQPNLFRPSGAGWRTRRTPTAQEDEADEYAGAFICVAGYNIERVVAALKRLPKVHGDTAHSDGDKRARTALDAYQAAGCELSEAARGSGHEDDEGPTIAEDRGDDEPETREPCSHAKHPRGHATPCVHQAHAFDWVQCQHACSSPFVFGPFPCHQADQAPCSHAAHEADVEPCDHPAHPEGDVVD